MVNHPVYGLLWPICDRLLRQQETKRATIILSLILNYSVPTNLAMSPVKFSYL